MKHTTLYRKWRPRAFSEISGQEPVVRTLRRAIETGRVAHAYLFSGPRGTGKTSTAKVLAMGLNCVQGPTPEPDGTCESCRAIINNSSMDVVEMDAASNRGIDEIRELRDRVNLAPAAGRMKVYIIDEVHMLTAEAFNALLKMLEEPPEHVIFVLATTEKHKVLPTIISRCQSFDFRRPGVETLAEKLAEIAGAEGIEAEPEALTIIAREGRGSFRDAEGLLDQLSSFAEGEVTAGMVRELLGSVGPEALLETTAALHGRRAADALRVVDRLSNEGRDLGQFAGEMLEHLRRLMLLPHAPEIALAEVGADERPALEEQAGAVPTAEVVRLIEAVGEARGRIRRGGDPKLELELTFLKLARDYAEPPVDNLLRRLETLEAAISRGRAFVSEQDPASIEELSEGNEGVVEETEDSEETAAGTGGDATATATGLGADWPDIMRELKDRRQALTAAVYGEARIHGFDGKVLELSFPEEHSFFVDRAQETKHVEELGKVLEDRLGFRPRLECRVDGSGETTEAAVVPQEAPFQNTVREEVENYPNSPVQEQAPETGPDERVAPEAEGGDGIIRDQREVFAMARERFGLAGNDGGS